MPVRKGMPFLQVLLFGTWSEAKRCNVDLFSPSVSVNIIILVLAVILFLLVLHHNFLSLNNLLRNEVTGRGTPADPLVC